MEYSINFKELVQRNQVRLIPLTEDYKFKSFNCGNADLNDFLFCDAKRCKKHLRFTTFLLETKEHIIAYYSLSNDLLTINDQEDFADELEAQTRPQIKDYWDNFLEQRHYPAAKIGRLAIDERFQDQGIGTMLVNSLVRSFVFKNKTGCQFITVDALNNPCTLKFYETNGFKYLTLNDVTYESRVMYKSLLEYINI